MKRIMGILIIIGVLACLGCSKEDPAKKTSEATEKAFVKEYPNDVDVSALDEWERDKEAKSNEAIWMCPACKGDRHMFGVEAEGSGHVQCRDCGKWLKYPSGFQTLLEKLNK